MDKIAVLIPCYNEEKTIAKVVKDAREALPEADMHKFFLWRTLTSTLLEICTPSLPQTIFFAL